MKLYNHLTMMFTRACLCLPTLLSEENWEFRRITLYDGKEEPEITDI